MMLAQSAPAGVLISIFGILIAAIVMALSRREWDKGER